MSSIISLILFILTIGLVGYAIKELLYRHTRMSLIEEISLILGFGLGITPLLMFYLGLTGVSLMVSNLLLLLGPVAATAVVLLWRRWRRPHMVAQDLSPSLAPALARSLVCWSQFSGLEKGMVALIGCSILFATLLALSKPPDVWDAVAIWGYKTHVLYHEQTISSDAFLPSAGELTRIQLRPNYPLGLPLLQYLVAVFIGVFDQYLLKTVTALFFLLLILSMYSQCRCWFTRRQTLLACALLISIPFLYYQSVLRILLIGGKKSNLLGGMADLPLTCFIFLSLTWLYRWFEQAKPVYLITAAMFGAAAAFMKDEGLAMSAVSVGTLLLFAVINRRDRPVSQVALFLTIWLVMILPWLFFRSRLPLEAYTERLQWNLADVARLMQRLPESLGFFVREAGHIARWGMIWILFLVLSLMLWRRIKASRLKYLYLIIFGSLALECVVVALAPLANLERSFYESRAVARFLFQIAPVAIFLTLHVLVNLQANPKFDIGHGKTV